MEEKCSSTAVMACVPGAMAAGARPITAVMEKRIKSEETTDAGRQTGSLNDRIGALWTTSMLNTWSVDGITAVLR